MKRLFLFSVLILFLAPLKVTGDELGNNKLKVAVVLGLTGGASTHSDSVRKGVELAREHLRGLGWTVDIVFEDDQTNPAKTVSAFRSLISRGYRFFIGPTWSFQIKAVKPLLTKAEVLTIIPTGSSLVNGGAQENVFNLCPRRDRQGPVLARWLTTQEGTRALIFTPNGDWGDIHRSVFNEAILDSNGEVIADEQYNYGIDISSVKTILAKASKAGANMIFTTGAAYDMANVLRARNLLNLDLGILATNDLQDAQQQGLVELSEFRAHDFVIHLPTNEEFRAQYEPKYGEPSLLYADRGYDALMLLSHAVSKTDGEIKSVKAYLQNQLDYRGATGRIRFDESGDVKDGDYLLSSLTEGGFTQ